MRADHISQKGKQRTEGSNARAVLNLDALMGSQSPLKGGMASYDVAVKLVAALEYTQPHFIRELHAKAARGESLSPVDVVRISRDDPRH
jgi:hypothetical protein